MNAVFPHIEAVFAEIKVLALQTVEPFSFNGFILRGALITKILLGKRFVDLAVVGLANLIAECDCLRGGERKDLNGLLARIVGARHAHCYIANIAVVVGATVHLAGRHAVKALLDEILSELHHGMRPGDPPVPFALLATGLFARIIEAGEAGEAI